MTIRHTEGVVQEIKDLRRRLDKANAVATAVDRYWMGKPTPYEVSAALTEWRASEDRAAMTAGNQPFVNRGVMVVPRNQEAKETPMDDDERVLTLAWELCAAETPFKGRDRFDRYPCERHLQEARSVAAGLVE